MKWETRMAPMEIPWDMVNFQSPSKQVSTMNRGRGNRARLHRVPKRSAPFPRKWQMHPRLRWVNSLISSTGSSEIGSLQTGLISMDLTIFYHFHWDHAHRNLRESIGFELSNLGSYIKLREFHYWFEFVILCVCVERSAVIQILEESMN